MVVEGEDMFNGLLHGGLGGRERECRSHGVVGVTKAALKVLDMDDTIDWLIIDQSSKRRFAEGS